MPRAGLTRDDVVASAAGLADEIGYPGVTMGLLADRLGVAVVAAFASASAPSVPEAVAALRARTGGPVAVASYLLAPGQFQDQLADSGAEWVTAPLGGHPALAGLVSQDSAARFTGPYSHRTVAGGIGHNLPQEAPEAFIDAVLEVGTLQ